MLAPPGAGPNRLCHLDRLTKDRMADIARLTEVIEPEAKALGYELVRVKMFASGPE